jgi:hypothetical protein
MSKDRIAQFSKITKFYEKVISLKAGEAFGEIALITK